MPPRRAAAAGAAVGQGQQQGAAGGLRQPGIGPGIEGAGAREA